MKRCLRIIVTITTLCCLMLAVLQFAQAAEMRVCEDDVNFRAEASLDAQVFKTLSNGTGVEVLEHNPGGWSKVSVNGTIGYIKSDYLTIPAGTNAFTFRTTDGVNFRTGPSLEAEVIRTLNNGTSVEMIEHDPVGWSKVKVDGTVGYVNSDFLSLTGSSSGSSGTSGGNLKTSDGVNFRNGPSTDAGIITTLNANTSVEVLERESSGWTKVRYDDNVGYIKSEFLSVTGRNVELLEWSYVRTIIQRGVAIPVIDVRTGISYTIKCFSVGDHADVEPATKADTDTMFNIRGGVWSWAARPVWVTIDNHLIAASLHGMPHDVSTIADNGMNGHLCLHFLWSTTSSSSESYKADLQNAVQEAWNAR